jgi:Zn-dependent protease
MRERKNGRKNPLWVLGTAAAFILAKGKAILPLLKLGKAGGAIISMLVSVGAYAILFPVGFAIGLVLLIFIHELGHVLAAKRKGLPVTAPVFIPFLGAMINMKKNPRDAATEAYMALGGPLLGSVGAFVTWLIALYTEHPLMYSLAYVGFFINLINLIPIHPLDGGRIATAVSRWLWLVGLIGGLVLIFYLQSIILIIVWLMFAWDLYKKYVKFRKHGESRAALAIFDVAAAPLLEQGYFIPGPEHKRELAFTTYSDLADERQIVHVFWESLQFDGQIPIVGQGIIKKAHVVKIDHLSKEDGLHLAVHCQVEYETHMNDAYYEVPVASRWKFGLAYGGLASVLAYMVWHVSSTANL